MAKHGVDDPMFCEACGAHRHQLGLAGDDIRTCPNCGRATCTNCWNQIAGACLACRAFALPIVAAAPKPAVAAAAGMPGVVAAAAVPSTAARVARFGHIRIGRVIRATAIGSTLAISIAAVGFAGVSRLGPTTAPVAPQVASPETAGPWFATAEPRATATQVPRTTDPSP